MKMEEIRAIALDRGVRPGRMKKSDLVRAIQTTEGNRPCYGLGEAGNCDQDGCLWRKDCT